MLDVAAIADAAKTLHLRFDACRLTVESRDRTAADGNERTFCRTLIAGIHLDVIEPSGWLWGDTGLIRVTQRADLERYDGLLVAGEIGAGTQSTHVRSLTGSTWRVATFREESGGIPTHLAENVTLLGASLHELKDLANARLRYRRYWTVASDDRSRPVAARLVDLYQRDRGG